MDHNNPFFLNVTQYGKLVPGIRFSNVACMPNVMYITPQPSSNLLWYAAGEQVPVLGMPLMEVEPGVGGGGSRKRAGKHYTVEDEALDRIAKEVSPQCLRHW